MWSPFMKKSLFLILLSLSTLIQAQQRMVIVHNGKADTIPVWKIDSIHFLDFDYPETKIPKATEAVDLGLSMKWAPWNIGAKDSKGSGFLFGWGNPDPENHSTNPNYFPTPFASSNITNTENDVAQAYWGDLWHMPTVEDFEELKSKCTWQWVPERKAYKISNKNDSSKFIYLPVTGYAIGESSKGEGSGYYWTGTVSPQSSANAEYFNFTSQQNSPTIYNAGRYYRMAIRPVYGEYTIPVTIVSTSAVCHENSVTISVHIEGEGEDLTYGILYSTLSDVKESTAEKQVFSLEAISGSRDETIDIVNLKYDTKYYYRAFVKVGADTFVEGEDHEFRTEVDKRIVDLGLSVKWSSWNIGATSEGEYGYLEPWGASDGGSAYYGGGNISGTDYDIAHAEWGDEWRMPTREEFQELVDNCTASNDVVVVDNKFHYGVRFSRNGKSIFIPFCGYGSADNRTNEGAGGYYWTSEGIQYSAYGILFVSPDYQNYYEESAMPVTQCRGIRAVYGTRNTDNIIDNPDDNPGGDDPENPGGDTPSTPDPGNPVLEDVRAVDLGLTSGTLWANKNVGAVSASDAGYYYSWGEVDSLKENFLKQYYLYYQNRTFVRIGNPGEEGIAGTEYDAATVTWGSDWKIPIPEQFRELMEECTWTWDDMGEVPGYSIASKQNGKSIFLPAVNYYSGGNKGENGIGYYWSSSLFLFDEFNYNLSMALYIEDGSKTVRYHAREDGLPIRPVKSK